MRGVLSIGAHHVAIATIMGIVIPMKPAIELTGSRGIREVCISRMHGGNRHTEISASAGASSHSRHRRVEALIFGDVVGDVRGHGGGGWWCCRGEDHGPVGTPTGRVGVLVPGRVRLLGMRAGWAGLFGLLGFAGVAFGGVHYKNGLCQAMNSKEEECKAPKAKGTDYCIGHLNSLKKMGENQDAALDPKE